MLYIFKPMRNVSQILFRPHTSRCHVDPLDHQPIGSFGT